MMLMRLLLVHAFLTPMANASGSYWVVYDGKDTSAPEACDVEDGEMVDDSCCTDVGPLFGLISDSYSSNCFVISGLLGEEGGSLQSYLGCDDGVPLYGEGCYNEGKDGGVIPFGTQVNDTNATDIKECGCTFQVAGNGYHKIRDFSVLPGFEDDTRQVFLYMNETCGSKPGDDAATDAPATDATDPPAPGSSSSNVLGFSTIVLAAIATIVVL